MATYESRKYAIPGANITNIAATAIADGSVDNTEFQSVDTTTSINTQLVSKLPKAGGTMTGGIVFPDDTGPAPAKVSFGAGDDLRIFSDGSVGIMKGNDLRFKDSSDNEMLKAVTSGSVKLSHSGSTKLETSATGVSISGTVSATTASATTGSFTNISGNGSSITSLNASNLSSGTVPAARLPVTGRLLKMQTLVSTSNYDTTSVIPFDSSTPTSSEGIQVMAQTYAPVASNSQLLHVLSSAVTNASAGGTVLWSIFNGSSNIAAFANTTGSSAIWNQFTCQAYESNTGSSSRTYTVRFGVNTSRGHWLQTNNYQYFLGAKAYYTIFEIAV